MIADPTSITTTLSGGIDSTTLLQLGETQDALVFNTTSVGPGSKTERRISSGALASEELTSCKLSISHSPTNQGRTRSVVRVDVSALDTQGNPHSAAAYLVLDKETALTEKGNFLGQVALRAVVCFFLEEALPAGTSWHARAVEFYDGEA
jgi:hypothetical protein